LDKRPADAAGLICKDEERANPKLVGAWNRRYLFLPVALIPLLILLLSPANQNDISQRFSQTVSKLSEQDQARINESISKQETTLEDVVMALPGHRIEDAHLSRDSWRHWLYAAMAAGVFFLFLILVFPSSTATPQHLLMVGLFTGTIGILLLLGFQVAAAVTQGLWLRGANIVTVLFYVVKFIGYSYTAALDPNNGFLLSSIGFICGVGFCEEVCKMLPLVRHFRSEVTLDWRGAYLWGLASGVGFGISEGITYASNYYNGIQTAEVYAVRFISCVALHAIWSGAAAIMLFDRQHLVKGRIEGAAGILEFLLYLLTIVAVPMVLHGFYDTLLKKEMNDLAFFVAVASFGWMAFQVERLRRVELQPQRLPTVAGVSIGR